MKRLTAILIICTIVFCLGGCAEKGAVENSYPDERVIMLSDSGITLDGKAIDESTESAVFASNDVIYYEDKDTYESGNPYGEGSASERHSAEDAEKCTVVNITKAGTYRISGKLSDGQLRVDLGKDAYENPDCVVNLILDNADISCAVAPAVLFLNVYECDNNWNTDTAKPEIDTTAAGANVIIADGSVNSISGSHVAKIFKDNDEEKKLWKQDGAFYSYMSLNIDGEDKGDGVLNITADNEGIDSELHLSINGGNIKICSQDDGINTNEDGVSVTTINGGSIHILGGLGEEGDGIDSNGWLVINGGTVISMANPGSDAGLDSDMGSYINGGTVVALGSTMDWPESDSEQVTINLQFAERQNAGDAIVVKDTDGSFVFAYDPSDDEVASTDIRQYQGAVISCSAFELEKTYNVFLGGSIVGSEVSGIYDIKSITDYTDGVKQAYSGTDIRGGMKPGDMQEPPEMPDGEKRDAPGGEPPMPQDNKAQNDNPTEKPEGDFKPQDFGGTNAPTPPQESSGSDNGIVKLSTEFTMYDKVNYFSGVRAE